MNFHHNPVWGKGQLCLDIGNPVFFGGMPAFDDQPRVRPARRKSHAPRLPRVSLLDFDLFNPAPSPPFVEEVSVSARVRKPRAPRQVADQAEIVALLAAFEEDAFFIRALAEDIFHVTACVAVSSRWASEWPALEHWIKAASSDEGGAGFWCEAAGLDAEDVLPAFWEGVEAQRAEPDQDERAVRAYGENLGEVWPVYRRMTIELKTLRHS